MSYPGAAAAAARGRVACRRCFSSPRHHNRTDTQDDPGDISPEEHHHYFACPSPPAAPRSFCPAVVIIDRVRRLMRPSSSKTYSSCCVSFHTAHRADETARSTAVSTPESSHARFPPRTHAPAAEGSRRGGCSGGERVAEHGSNQRRKESPAARLNADLHDVELERVVHHPNALPRLPRAVALDPDVVVPHLRKITTNRRSGQSQQNQ